MADFLFIENMPTFLLDQLLGSSQTRLIEVVESLVNAKAPVSDDWHWTSSQGRDSLLSRRAWT